MPSIETAREEEEGKKNNSEFKSDKQRALESTTSFSSLSLIPWPDESTKELTV